MLKATIPTNDFLRILYLGEFANMDTASGKLNNVIIFLQQLQSI